MATIQESFVLPSHGKLYAEEFNPRITLRSMTTEEEMKRLSPSDNEFENLAEIIDACIKEELPVKAYDMCIGDFQFLLHKLRVVTYGSDYKMMLQCPNCGEVVKSSVNLDDEEVHEFNEDEGLDLEITLPVTKHVIKLSLQTPRMLDVINSKAKEQRKKTKLNIKYEVMYTAMSLINTIDGQKANEMKKEKFVRELPLKDTNYILQKGDEINGKVGLDASVIAKCPNCTYEVVTNFRIQPEFFGPEVN